MRILFITATRVGDAVLTTGLLAHLLAAYPSADVTVACGPQAAGVFARVPRLSRIIPVEKRRYDLHWLILWSKLCRLRWDLVVDLRGSALGWLLPARRRRIMRGGRRPGHRLTHLAAVLDLPHPPAPTIWIAPADHDRACALLPPAPLLGLGPTANWAGKIWPADRFAALARLFPGLRPVIFAGPGPAERRAAAPVLAALPQAIDLAGQLTLAEAAACLSRCAAFVGNDSGLMHLAAAAGTPTLGLFGPSRAEEYAPQGQRAASIVSPDGTMAGLAVPAVAAALRPLLAAPLLASLPPARSLGAPSGTPSGTLPGTLPGAPGALPV